MVNYCPPGLGLPGSRETSGRDERSGLRVTMVDHELMVPPTPTTKKGVNVSMLPSFYRFYLFCIRSWGLLDIDYCEYDEDVSDWIFAGISMCWSAFLGFQRSSIFINHPIPLKILKATSLPRPNQAIWGLLALRWKGFFFSPLIHAETETRAVRDGTVLSTVEAGKEFSKCLSSSWFIPAKDVPTDIDPSSSWDPEDPLR